MVILIRKYLWWIQIIFNPKRFELFQPKHIVNLDNFEENLLNNTKHNIIYVDLKDKSTVSDNTDQKLNEGHGMEVSQQETALGVKRENRFQNIEFSDEWGPLT